ncbi:MAG: hypothetical protein AB8G22_05355 [Saprospiraceae bacterium]
MKNRFVAAARRRKFTAFVLTIAFSGAVLYGVVNGGDAAESWSEYLPETVQEWMQADDAPEVKAVKTRSKGA